MNFLRILSLFEIKISVKHPIFMKLGTNTLRENDKLFPRS